MIVVGKAKNHKPRQEATELKLTEFLILAALWMLLGFMLWYYLSAFHGIPARVMSEAILAQLLENDFSQY